MPQETLTLPLTALLGWDGRGGELETAPGPPKSGGSSQQLEQEDVATIISYY